MNLENVRIRYILVTEAQLAFIISFHTEEIRWHL